MRNLGRGLILGGSVLFVAASGCTVITDVDRSKIQDDVGVSGSAGSAGAPGIGGGVSAGSGGTGGAEGGSAGSAGAPPATGGSETGGAAGSPGGEGGGAGSPAGAGGGAGAPGGAGGGAGAPGGAAGTPAGAGGGAGTPGGAGGGAGTPGGAGGVTGSPAGAGGVAGSQAGAGGGAGAPAGAGGVAPGGAAGQGGGPACSNTVCGAACVDLQTNANHCGECDYLCAGTNTTTTSCSSGTCAPSCAATFGNCVTPTPPTLDDGCETSFTDPTTCGTTCDNTRQCSTTNVDGTPTCSATGLCNTTSCDSGWANCAQPSPPTADDGCETNILTTTANCGGCARGCNPTNVAAMACAGGICTSACNSGFGNCSQPAAPNTDDGCETNLNDAVNDCGACDHACALTNATARDCQAGVCVPTCSGSYLNCNTPGVGTADDGCETNGDSVDSCGNDCGSVKVCSSNNVGTRSCNSGECSPTCLTGYLNCSADEHADNDGCETPNATAASCGSDCNDLHACSTANTDSVACPAGSCVPTCSAGYLDCSTDEDDSVDGCETPNSTAASCGSDCLNLVACDTTNTDSVACTSGTCDPTCSTGYLNCSADESQSLDGCETNEAALYWDETQCGTGCGDVVACNTGAGEMCLQGSCQTGAIVVAAGDSIQDAIDSVPDAGTAVIVVEADTYTEDLSIINKAITLLSDDGPGSVTIVGVQKSLSSEFPLARPNIDIQADDVVIDGFVIESPALACGDASPPPEAEYSSGIVLTGRNIEIMNNAFYVGTADGSQGIQTYQDDNAPVGLRDITGLDIHDNTFTDNGPCSGGTGTPLNAYEAIYLNTQSDTISLIGDAVYIRNNTFDGLLFRALTTEREWVLFTGNTVSSSLGEVTDEVYPAGVNAQADNVAINDNALNGLESAVRIGTGASLSGDGSIYMHGNCITGNDVAVRFDGTANGHTIDATGNWWGVAPPPAVCDGAPSSIGNCAYVEVVTTGWLTAAPGICP